MQESSSIEGLKGVGGKTAAFFLEMGIATVGDLLMTLPKGYKYRMEGEVSSAAEGDQILARAVLTKALANQYHNGFAKSTLVFTENGFEFKAVFYNQPFRKNMAVGCEYFIYGVVSLSQGKPIFINPETDRVSDSPFLKPGIYPVYPLPFKSHIKQKKFASAIKAALEKADLLEEAPLWLLDSLSLPSRAKALEFVHMPHSDEELNFGLMYFAARRLIASQAMIIQNPQVFAKRETAKIENYDISRFEESFGIEFTEGQAKAISDIASDLKSGYQMNRLIEGDVGSGKTAVALCACYMAASSGWQSAFLAPTEALARQHWEKSLKSLNSLGVTSALLCGSMAPKEKRAAQNAVESGEAKVVFGTHALFSASFVFKDLLLVSIDEQQRYGVSQRAQMAAKAALPPHTLALSATPIPRTLALALNGDMDISAIHGMPKGRIPVLTYIQSPDKRARIYSFIEKRASLGEKAFIVCPAIDQEDYESVEAVCQEAKKAMPSIKVAKLTGAMGEAERQSNMAQFAYGDASAIVATTIVEVGIDVGAATIMWILDSHRFGLSQLHQLRGRVGRSEKQSWCILEAPPGIGKTAISRLKTLRSMYDGFSIAKADLEIRGSGERYGLRQSGKLSSILDDALDFPEIAQKAQEAAKRLVSSDKTSDINFLRIIESDASASLESVVMN